MSLYRSETCGTALAALMLSVSLTSCGVTPIPAGQEVAFRMASSASNDNNWQLGAAAAWAFVQDAGVDDERYDRGLILMARALEELGLSYAASLYYLEVARERRDAELIDDAVQGIERIVRSGPHDEPTLIRGFIATSDIHALPDGLQGFVDYHNGVDSLRRGLDAWATTKLEGISDQSPYYRARAQYALAVRSLQNGDLTSGREALTALAERTDISADLARDIQLALARTSMEQRDYEEAVAAYERVRTLAPERPGLLLEMAWAHYYLGDSRRALGLLIALDAPVHRGLIAPERFLLEAFCLRRLCQLDPARTAANRLQNRYEEALGDIHRGILPVRSRAIREGAKRRGVAREIWLFGQRLRNELEAIREYEAQFGESFTGQLERIYVGGIEEAIRRLEAELSQEVEALASELLRAEDGVRLILHELSVQLLRGRRRPEGPPERDTVDTAAGGERVSYRFSGEFWTDELDELVVDIADRCIE